MPRDTEYETGARKFPFSSNPLEQDDGTLFRPKEKDDRPHHLGQVEDDTTERTRSSEGQQPSGVRP